MAMTTSTPLLANTAGADIALATVAQADLQEMVDRLYQQFQDYRIQASSTLLVRQQQHREKQVQDLTVVKESQARQIELPQRRCKAFQADKPQPTTH